LVSIDLLVESRDSRTNPGIDLLASVYRSAIARRSPDTLLSIHATLGPVVEIDPRELSIVAHVGDDGPRPNPLWSRWVGHGRTLTLVAAPSERAPSKKHLPDREP
jgi:hypothetical protein